jgi:hypothetical protein
VIGLICGTGDGVEIERSLPEMRQQKYIKNQEIGGQSP